ncbi:MULTISPECIES: class Ib ribonucleoside-diphosphate reductase assembly flavoprotein NrdI [Holzapfeliella]|uniref:Class Ib ribonucleoside-diphosphate reductase assembly flavoprotein NrdI n=1 Tax=Holzapfeliella saturejae TaxID=3082953 RepID=A0ABU8SFE2_9LACO
MKLAFYTLTGQTRRFMKKLDLPSYEISDEDPFHEMNEPFILIVPSYELELVESILEFLDYGSNAENLVGVAGGGNKNFNHLYLHTAKKISEHYDVPIIFDFEFNGTNKDVEEFKKVVKEYES